MSEQSKMTHINLKLICYILIRTAKHNEIKSWYNEDDNKSYSSDKPMRIGLFYRTDIRIYNLC